jgi:hypothetical protein
MILRMYCLDLRCHTKAIRFVSGTDKCTDVHLLLAFRPVVLPLNFGIQWLGRIIPILEVPVFHSRPGDLAVVSEILCSCFCQMFSTPPQRLSQYLPMQLYVTYTIEKVSFTKIIVLHDVTSRVMVKADSFWRLTAEARFGAMARPCGNCGLQSGTARGVSPSTSGFLR